MKIIDSHHHLWNFNKEDYGWMDDSMDILRKNYLPADMEVLLAEPDVEGTVVVQARQNLEETEWLLSLAKEYDFIKGVVGWLDLRSDKIDEQFERFASHPKLVGVRHVIHDELDDDFMLRPAFVRGLEKLAKYDLTYDLLLFPKHLTNAIELVSRFPEIRFVVDHLAKPFIKSGILAPWQDDISCLSASPNVWCKISGMVTEADVKEWDYNDFIPYMDVIVQAFGTDRIMLGSDWPVCSLAGEYKDILDIPVKYFASFSKEDQEKIYANNCIEFYKLKL